MLWDAQRRSWCWPELSAGQALRPPFQPRIPVFGIRRLEFICFCLTSSYVPCVTLIMPERRPAAPPSLCEYGSCCSHPRHLPSVCLPTSAPASPPARSHRRLISMLAADTIASCCDAYLTRCSWRVGGSAPARPCREAWPDEMGPNCQGAIPVRTVALANSYGLPAGQVPHAILQFTPSVSRHVPDSTAGARGMGVDRRSPNACPASAGSAALCVRIVHHG
jgi:hypothetical protein